jgi:hypothetical protein
MTMLKGKINADIGPFINPAARVDVFLKVKLYSINNLVSTCTMAANQNRGADAHFF